MVEQLQLYGVDNTNRHGNAALNYIIKRLSVKQMDETSFLATCARLPVLSGHDAKDLTELLRKETLPPYTIERFMQLTFESHDTLIKKALANAWLNHSADTYLLEFGSCSIKDQLDALKMLPRWRQTKIIHDDEIWERQFVRLCLSQNTHASMFQKCNENVRRLLKHHQEIVACAVDIIVHQSVLTNVHVAVFLNEWASSLTDEELHKVQQFAQRHQMWELDVCGNLRDACTQRREQKLLTAVVATKSPRPPHRL